MAAGDTETEISADGSKIEGSVGEGDNNDNDTRRWSGDIDHSVDDDDDEDNWSRKVETDDIIQRMPSSVTGGETNTIYDDEDGRGISVTLGSSDGHHDHHEQIRGQQQQEEQQPALIPQPQPLPTMKEKLVERERQRRVESERARWKRQFAMAAHAESEHDEDDNNNNNNNHEDNNGDTIAAGDIDDHDRSFVNHPNSVGGTVGEDTVAPIETLEEDNNDSNMNYPMERFLQERQGTGMEDADGNNNNNNINNSLGNKNETTNQGVVMERFTNGFLAGVGGSSTSSALAPVHVDSLPNEPEVGQTTNELPLLDVPSNDSTTNINNELSVGPIGDNELQSPSQEPRVVFRLTEAEIQEMAAIDDASRSNAPPSERDDMSELGELVSDFGGLTHIDNQTMSQGTPVTAMESVTSSIGNQIGRIMVLSGSSSDHGIDGILGHSISSNIVASSAGGDGSLTGNPPSDIVRDDDDDDDDGRIVSPRSSQFPTEILPVTTTVDVSLPRFAAGPVADATISTDDSETELKMTAADETIVNRTMRPGMFNYKQRQGIGIENLPEPPSSTLKTSTSYPNQQTPPGGDNDNHNHIEGFDFDKNDCLSSPHSPSIVDEQGNVVAARNGLWSPGFSPMRDAAAEGDDNNNTIPNTLTAFPDYGAAATATEDDDHDLETQRFGSGGRTKTKVKKKNNRTDDERQPLLEGIPPAVKFAVNNHRRESSWGSLRSARNMDDLNSLAESVFSDIRSESTATRMSISNEAQDYLGCSVLKRAFPERMFALTVTLLFEIPVIFLISGGSDQLCALIGRTKYTTLIALLPIVSAISGNVGLQASTLTTRAISHGQVKVENYRSWLVKEIGAAVYLGKILLLLL